MTREEAIVTYKYSNNKLASKFIDALEQAPKTDVIDEIRTEIEKQEKWLMAAGYNAYNVDIAFSSIKSVLTESEVK